MNIVWSSPDKRSKGEVHPWTHIWHNASCLLLLSINWHTGLKLLTYQGHFNPYIFSPDYLNWQFSQEFNLKQAHICAVVSGCSTTAREEGPTRLPHWHKFSPRYVVIVVSLPTLSYRKEPCSRLQMLSSFVSVSVCKMRKAWWRRWHQQRMTHWAVRTSALNAWRCAHRHTHTHTCTLK